MEFLFVTCEYAASHIRNVSHMSLSGNGARPTLPPPMVRVGGDRAQGGAPAVLATVQAERIPHDCMASTSAREQSDLLEEWEDWLEQVAGQPLLSAEAKLGLRDGSFAVSGNKAK